MTNPMVAIAVGVGAADQDAVLEFAAAEAERCGTYLRLVHAYTVPPHTMGSLYGYDFPASFRRDGEDLLAEAWARVSGRHPTIRARTVVTRGTASHVLEKESLVSQALVLGHDLGKPVLMRMYEGRSASHLARHSHCPVIVVPDDWSEPEVDPRVVVLLDRVHPDRGTYDFALQKARQRSCPVAVVHADLHAGHDAARRAVEAVHEVCARASLLVVGQTPPRTADHSVLGHLLISNAICPVAVVPTTHPAEWDGVPQQIEYIADIP